jgi:AAHS family benzoate transporter-like MFS transporter
MALPLQQNFMAIAIPAVIAAISVSLIRHGKSASAGQAVGKAALADPAEA